MWSRNTGLLSPPMSNQPSPTLETVEPRQEAGHSLLLHLPLDERAHDRVVQGRVVPAPLPPKAPLLEGTPDGVQSESE